MFEVHPYRHVRLYGVFHNSHHLKILTTSGLIISRWLYTPRGCAVFYVPFRNQHLIRTSLPTSWRYRDDEAPDWSGKSRFVMIFEFVATMDHSSYCCVPAAIQFRKTVCGGEGEILKYCWNLAARGGQRVADILGTEIMANKSGSLAKCCFSTIKLPIVLRDGEGALVKGEFHSGDASKIKSWLNKTAYKEFDTYLQIDSHAGAMWVRLSAQIYLELQDYEWLGPKLKELCHRLVE
jgi:selenocysteine lyase/cysteine desulfurase